MASPPEKLYVTYVDGDRDLLKIWGQRNRIGATYIERQLLQLLPEFNRTVSPNPNRIHKGMFCFAKYTDDNYYRARVISRVQEDAVGVLFVDYGNRDVIKLSNIRILEGNEGDVLAKMSEQAEEYYLAKIAAPPHGWTIEILTEIRRDICYDEFHYQITSQICDQKILEIRFRDEDFSTYLVKKQLARPLSLPAQRELILTYCSLVSNELKPVDRFRDSPRLPFPPSLPPPGLRVPLRPANLHTDINMHLNYAKPTKPITFPCPPPPAQYSSPRHPRAPLHTNGQLMPKGLYLDPLTQMEGPMSGEPAPPQAFSSALNPLASHQLDQLYQMQGNPPSTSNNGNLIEIIAQQVKQYIAKDSAKSETEVESVPHHYVNSVLEVGNTYNAVISHIDDGPWSFSIQLLPSEEELKKLMKDLSSVELVPIKPPIILGHPCLAVSTLHGSLCRGVVVSISRSAVKVYFVDFGNTEDLLSSSIYQLPPKFFKVGVLSQKFSLSGLQKVAYSDDIKKFFEEVVKDEVLVLRVDSLEDDNLPTCELYIKQRNIKRILNEKMRELRSSSVEHLPKIGDTESVLVTWVVSPQKFFVQMKKREPDLTALKKELSEVGTKGQTVTYHQLSVGFKCVCLYQEDGQWYRVVITSIDAESAITVFYVDYGNVETVSLSLLRKIDGPCLINQMGNQAVQCCLKGFEAQSYDPELSRTLESLIMEKEFQMTVASLEKQLLCVNLFGNGKDVGTLLLEQSKPKANEPDISTLSGGSNWDSPESRKPTGANRLERENKYQFDNFHEKKGMNTRPNQIRSDERDGRREEKTSFGESERYWGEPKFDQPKFSQPKFDQPKFNQPKFDQPKFDQPKPWKTRERGGEFGSWEGSKPSGNRGGARGYEESKEGGRGEFGQRGNRTGRSEWKGGEFGEKRFGGSRGRRSEDEWKGEKQGTRFEGERGGEDARRRFGDRSNGPNERQSSRGPMKRENIAPPGSKFDKKVIEMGSCRKGIVTYYFSPDEFFVQLLDEEQEFRRMMREIQEYYSDKYSIRDPLKAGDIVIAEFSLDKVLYRAEVIKASPVTVRYVDYGNQEPVPPKGTWFVDKRFLRLGEQMVRCRLSGVQPMGSDWPPPGSPVDRFFEFSAYKCTFLRQEGDLYEIAMEAVDNGKDMRSEIIAAGLGRPVEAAEAEGPALDIPETDYSLLQNQTLRLCVSHVESSSKFYVVVNPKAVELIAEAIAAIETKKSFAEEPVEVGTPCLATLEEGWYRGKIIKTDGNGVSVWFSDRGDSAELPREKVMRLPKFLRELQPQVAECSLHGVSGVDEENFKKTVECRNQLVHVVSTAGERLSVVLYDEEGRLLELEEGCDAPRAVEPIGQLPIISQKLPVVLSQVDSVREVYIQRVADEEELVNFLEQMNGFYAEGGEELEEEVGEGALVAARSSAYESWYRGRVVSSGEEGVEVLYIDYGNREVVPRAELRKLEPWFRSVAAFARRVGFGVEEAGEREKVVEKVWALCEEKSLVGEFRNRGGEMIVEVVADGESVTEALRRFVWGAGAKGEELRVLVSHIDCAKSFWVHKEAMKNELEQFEEKLQKACEGVPERREVEVGDLVAALFAGVWYRARVVSKEGAKATVQFIDYGNTSVVDLSCEAVKELPGELAEAPVWATRLALKGSWGENSTAKFEEIILRNEDFVSVVVVEEADPLVVDLIQNGRSVAAMLLEETTRPEDDLCTVCISHCVSPGDFYVVRLSCADVLKNIDDRLRDAPNFETPPAPQENALYAAKDPKDGTWCRARVTSATADTTVVHFVDYGNSSAVSELRCLPKDVADIPSQCENCCLALGEGVGEGVGGWSRAACELFAEYVGAPTGLGMRVVGAAGGRAVVRLWDGEREVGEALKAVSGGAEGRAEGWAEVCVTQVVSPREFYVRYVGEEEGAGMAGRVLRCSLELGEGEVSERGKKEFLEVVDGGAAVFEARIVCPGETNIISLKIDGRIVEETLEVIPKNPVPNTANNDKEASHEEEQKLPEEKYEEEEKLPDEKDEEEEKLPEEKYEEEEKLSEEKDDFEERENEKSVEEIHETSTETEKTEAGICGDSPETETVKAEEGSGGRKSPPGAKLKPWRKIVSGSVSLESMAGESGAVGAVGAEAAEVSQSAPNTPRPLRRGERGRRDADERLVPGCISTGIPLHCGPFEEKTALSEKIVPGAVNGTVDL